MKRNTFFLLSYSIIIPLVSTAHAPQVSKDNDLTALSLDQFQTSCEKYSAKNYSVVEDYIKNCKIRDSENLDAATRSSVCFGVVNNILSACDKGAENVLEFLNSTVKNYDINNISCPLEAANFKEFLTKNTNIKIMVTSLGDKVYCNSFCNSTKISLELCLMWQKTNELLANFNVKPQGSSVAQGSSIPDSDKTSQMVKIIKNGIISDNKDGDLNRKINPQVLNEPQQPQQPQQVPPPKQPQPPPTPQQAPLDSKGPNNKSNIINKESPEEKIIKQDDAKKNTVASKPVNVDQPEETAPNVDGAQLPDKNEVNEQKKIGESATDGSKTETEAIDNFPNGAYSPGFLSSDTGKPGVEEYDDENPNMMKPGEDGNSEVDEKDPLNQGESPLKPEPAPQPSRSVSSGVSDDRLFTDNITEEESHFYVYFFTSASIVILGYVAFHNKNKILAYALEGRRNRNGRRRPNSASYRKLDCSLEEAITSNSSHASVTNVVY